MLLDLFIYMQALNVVVATTIEVVSMGPIMVPSRMLQLMKLLDLVFKFL
jgi:hypothetical protein